MISTRIAPSPTGMMHVGTARTAIFNWIAARIYGGRFILRIDDTDAERNLPGMVQPIIDGLDWLGIPPDDIYYQSDRAANGEYKEWADLLLKAGFADRAENGAVLLRWMPFMPTEWVDRVGGPQKINAEERKHIDGLVLLRGDGSPTYHFASTADDYDLDVGFIIRGDDHRVNTGKHMAIWTAMAKALQDRSRFPMTAHVGLIHMNGKKMSKRDGAASLLDYRDAGYDPDAMFNFLLRMGWGPKVDDKSTALISRERALELFNEGRMRAAPANFDAAILASYDRKYKARKEAAQREEVSS